MGRKKIYITTEELNKHRNEYYREYRKKQLSEKTRKTVAHPCKHKKFYMEGIRVDIGTLDRTKIDTAYVDMMVTTSYTNDEEIINRFKVDARAAFNEWLDNQSMWDRRHKLCVLEYAPINRSYAGQMKSFSLQFHIRRDELTDWTSTFENLMDLVNHLIDTIKKTCLTTGLTLRKWKSSNPKALSSESTEPESGSGLLVEV